MKPFWALAALSTLGYAVWKAQHPATPLSLAGKVVLITGAAEGIGRATARAFAQAGAKLAVLDVQAEKLAALQAELEAQGTASLSISADVTYDHSAEEAIAAVQQVFGRLDVLVNNAGVIISGRLTDHDPASMERLVQVNLFGLLRMTQAALPLMQRQRSGHIVNLASISAALPAPGVTAYAATKGGVLTFSEALRREVAPDGLRVTAVMPGWIRTQMLAHMSDEAMQRAGMVGPGLDIRTPEAVAAAIVAAVQFNQRTVIVGAWGWKLFAALQRLAPRLVDALFPLLTKHDLLMQTAHRPKL